MNPRTEPLFLSWETKWKLKMMAAAQRDFGQEGVTADACAEKILADYFTWNHKELDRILDERRGIDGKAIDVFNLKKI